MRAGQIHSLILLKLRDRLYDFNNEIKLDLDQQYQAFSNLKQFRQVVAATDIGPSWKRGGTVMSSPLVELESQLAQRMAQESKICMDERMPVTG